MRKILFTLLFINALFCAAQKWCPPGAQWTYDYGGYCYGGYSRLAYVKDTIVLNQLCKKLSETTITTGCFSSGIDTSNLPSLYTYSQNDTVFFLNGGKFRPIYFFNAKIGDTLYIYNTECFSDSLVQQVVDSVGVFIYNNDSLRFYRAHNINVKNMYLYPKESIAVESIGSLNNYIIPYYPCHTDAIGYYLRCYQADAFVTYYTNPSIDCDSIYTTTVNLPETLIVLSPNPATSIIDIKISDNITIVGIALYNISGDLKIRSDKLHKESSYSIELNDLQNGLYILQVITSNGKTITKKFIKHSFN